jgi:branched-chain amino acid transport system ATP-binding protein
VTGPTPLLQVEGLFAGYGSGGDILRGIDLVLAEGEFLCLIGPNGAGKSTLLRAISGILRPRQGRILYRGKEIGGRRPDLLVREGIAHVPQGRSTFPRMSVWENLVMGAYSIRGRALARERIERAAQMFPIIAEKRSVPAGSLSGGEQKQVEMARAMVGAPALLLLDEPTLGLEPRAARVVVDTMRAANAGGTTILLVEQNARLGLSAAGSGCVMELGTVKLRGQGAVLLEDPEVKRLYLGAEASRPTPAAPYP